jgi:hypothetical protein
MEMISIQLSDIPAYLHSSELYKTFSQNSSKDQGEILSVPQNCFKKNTGVINTKDLCELLSTVRYWALDELPNEVYEFVTSNALIVHDIIEQFATQFPTLYAVQELPKSCWLAKTARLGDVHFMRYLHSRGYEWDNECCHAAGYGHLESLTYAHQNGCCLGTGDRCACKAALTGGHLECLKYARENGCSTNYEIESMTFWFHKNADCLEYVLNSAEMRQTPNATRGWAQTAIKLRSINCIDKLRVLGWDLTKDARAYPEALETRDTSIIAHMIQNNCWLDNGADVLLWRALEDTPEATRFPELLALLLNRGQHISISTFDKLTMHHQIEEALMRTILTQHACPAEPGVALALARMRSVDLLRFVFDQGYPPCAEVCTHAARLGDLAMLQCALDHGCAVSEATVEAALVTAQVGNEACLQYLLLLTDTSF